MPFTPLHFGPGLLFKSCLNRSFSFSLFVFSQVLMDLEPLYYMLQGEWFIHRFFHSYLGATVAALLTLIIGKPLCQWGLVIWNKYLDISLQPWFDTSTFISWPAAIISSAIGTYSHVLLDSFMHSDMHPLAPWSDENTLIHQINLEQLHGICVLSAVIGLTLWLSVRAMIRAKHDDR